MHLRLLIIGLVLFPLAHTLKCHRCIEGFSACPEMQCPAEKNQCGTIRLITYNGNSMISDFKSKSCAATQDCLQGSLNVGVSKFILTSECCSSDLCNNKNAPEPPKTKPNGKKCYRCDGNEDCRGTVNCEGDENQCIKVSVTAGGITQTLKGCATRNICSATWSIPGVNSKINCCEGNYCNGVNGVRASLLVLATMLMSHFFLSK
ncbi:urokinase plasminogen activator surface receptor-like isoform X2 [Eucyclogobius newberryi]|uniref:urokinase plasminogen activator surface receptor-like isoform X2 n=1 Tax=Eucyclogobius newberryi TaxID=166745 RepID=UPI003B5BF651